MLGFCAVGPAVYGCETCYKPGDTDPVGNLLDKAKCWTSDDGNWEICTVNSDDRNCTTSDTDPTKCPKQSSGGGDGGGGYGGGGGEGCTYTSAGVCPWNCISCSGGGGLY
jgi:hypothetical protein